MAPASESSLLRKTLLAVGIAVGGSALLTGASMLLAASALDHVVPEPGGAANVVEADEASAQPAGDALSNRS